MSDMATDMMDNTGDTDQVSTDSVVSDSVTDRPVSTGSWIDKIPEEFRGEECLQSIKDEASLVKGYVHSQKMLGNSVRIPGEDASPEALQDFYSKLDKIPGLMKAPDFNKPEDVDRFFKSLGKPQDKLGYELVNTSEKVSELLPEFDQVLDSYKDLFLKANLTKEQAKILYNNEIAQLEARYDNMLNEVQEGDKKLRELWGHDYHNRKAAATNMAKILADKYGDSAKQLVNVAGRNPVFADMLAQLAVSFKESGHIGLSSNQFGLTPEEALNQIKEIRTNTGHAYHNPKDPNHQAAKAKLQQLYQAAYPSE